MDFITDLPESCGYNAILTIVDRFSKLVKLVTKLLFDDIVRLYVVPESLVHDRDPRFTSDLWTALWKLMGTRTFFSTAHHPQTDG